MEASKIRKDPQIYVSPQSKELSKNMSARYDEFKSLDNKDFFILAVIFGYLKGQKGKKALKKADRASSGFTRERYLNDYDNSILKAIAVAEEGNMELAYKENIPAVYAIAEEYANGGTKDLKEFIFSNPASFVKKFSALLKKNLK